MTHSIMYTIIYNHYDFYFIIIYIFEHFHFILMCVQLQLLDNLRVKHIWKNAFPNQ